MAHNKTVELCSIAFKDITFCRVAEITRIPNTMVAFIKSVYHIHARIKQKIWTASFYIK